MSNDRHILLQKWLRKFEHFLSGNSGHEARPKMAYDRVGAARASIAQYLGWYNTERPHSSLDQITPEAVYQELLPK